MDAKSEAAQDMCHYAAMKWLAQGNIRNVSDIGSDYGVHRICVLKQKKMGPMITNVLAAVVDARMQVIVIVVR